MCEKDISTINIMVRRMEIIIEQKAYEDLRKLVKKLKEVSDEYKEVKDETLLRIFALAFTMNKIREEKIKTRILKEIEKKQEQIEKSKVIDIHAKSSFKASLNWCKGLIKKAFEGVEE